MRKNYKSHHIFEYEKNTERCTQPHSTGVSKVVVVFVEHDNVYIYECMYTYGNIDRVEIELNWKGSFIIIFITSMLW